MATPRRQLDSEEMQPLTDSQGTPSTFQDSDGVRASASSASTTSFVLEHANDKAAIKAKDALYTNASPPRRDGDGGGG